MANKKPKILSSYQKLKQKIADQEKQYNKLYEEFRKYHNGDFQTIQYWTSNFLFQKELEKALWYGSTSFNGQEK